MALLIILSTVFAWVSGALFAAGLGRRGARTTTRSSYPSANEYPGAGGWIRSPRILLQVGLLIAFVCGGLVLVVLSL